MCDVAGIFAQGYMPIIRNICIVDCSEFIWVIDLHSSLTFVHEVIGTSGISMAFEGHICCWHLYGYSMVNKVRVCWFFTFICCNVGSTCSLHYWYRVIYTWNVAGTFDKGHMPIIWIVSIPVFVVTLLMALNLYEVYILTQLSISACDIIGICGYMCH